MKAVLFQDGLAAFLFSQTVQIIVSAVEAPDEGGWSIGIGENRVKLVTTKAEAKKWVHDITDHLADSILNLG